MSGFISKKKFKYFFFARELVQDIARKLKKEENISFL